jgi:hypothetical protein
LTIILVKSGRHLPGTEGVIMDIEGVLDAYRNGDEDKRISLFLTYRDLRDEFSRIEQEFEVVQSPVPGGLTWLKWIIGYP